MTLKHSHILGIASIIIGALATFDSNMLPALRFLLIYFSLLMIVGVVIYSIYIDVDQSPTLDRIKDKL